MDWDKLRIFHAAAEAGSFTYAGDSLHMQLRRVDHTKFLLVSRGYRWINEFPFNR